MIRDVFYFGEKPNVHPRERFANDLVHARQLATTEHFWIVNELCDYSNFDWDFDFELLPDEDVWAVDFVNVFPSQWTNDSGTWLCPTVGKDDKVYRSDVDPIYRKNEKNKFWSNTDNTDNFDYSWHPDDNSPPYIYQFGTLLDELDGPRYTTNNNDGTIVYLERLDIVLEDLTFPKYYIKTTLEDLINEHDNEIFWALNPDLDYSIFDFKWIPDKANVYHVNCLGSPYNTNSQTYFVNGKMWNKGYRDINYIEDKLVEAKTKISMFFVDKGNTESAKRFEDIKSRYGNVIKTRYLNNWIDTINRCVNRSETKLCWILNSELDYSEFEFDYYPSPWQMNMVHVFGTQWSHWGNTFIVNKESFTEQTKYIKIIEHLPVLNFVKTKRTKAVDCLYDIVLIDHGNESHIREQLLEKTNKNVTVIQYKHSYLQTLKEYVNSTDLKPEHYVWVCSSICDYSTFDFTYICDPYTREQLHVFPSNKQKFGDTFLIDLNSFVNNSGKIDTLNEFDKVNYNSHQSVARLPAPEFTVEDSQSQLSDFDFNFPYAVFKTDEAVDIIDTEPLNVWDRNTMDILVTNEGASRIIAPKDSKDFIKGDVYDYPYISKSSKLGSTKSLDIVFLSNGEQLADKHYEKLLSINKKNRVVRVDGVNGRAKAYHAAAEASNTPWFFTVFAKLDMNESFDFSWQPDRLQARKHYIFSATNPVNNLEYGHQALIVYNKKLVLNNPGVGLDFTLDNLHEVVDINSGVARFDTDEYSTWRTSFRECIKLKDTVVNNPDDIVSIERLKTWATVGNGMYGEYSVNGALDAIEYYDSVNGSMDKLRLTYEWEWLKTYYKTKY